MFSLLAKLPQCYWYGFLRLPTHSGRFPRLPKLSHASPIICTLLTAVISNMPACWLLLIFLLFFLSPIWPCDDCACDCLRTVYIAGLYHLEPHLDLLLSGFQVSPHHVLICRSCLSYLVIWVPAPCLHLALVPASLAPLGHWSLCLSLYYYVLMSLPLPGVWRGALVFLSPAHVAQMASRLSLSTLPLLQPLH